MQDHLVIEPLGRCALAEGEIEDFVLSKIAKRGGKPLAPGEPMFIDAQESRAGPILEL